MKPCRPRSPTAWRRFAGVALALLGVGAGVRAGAAAPSASAPVHCGAPELAQEAVRRINHLRAQGALCGRRAVGALAPLSWQPQLAAGASAFAHELAVQPQFSHVGAHGGTLSERLRARGYAYRSAAENVAQGQRSLDEVLAAWMASDGHCANIMNGTLREVGLACVDSARDGPHWTLLLGAAKEPAHESAAAAE